MLSLSINLKIFRGYLREILYWTTSIVHVTNLSIHYLQHIKRGTCFFRLYCNLHDSYQWIIHQFIHTYLTLFHLIISLWVCILSKMIIQFSHKVLEFAARTGNRVSPEIPCVDYLCYKRSNFHDAHNLWLGTSVGRGSQLLS